MGGGLAGWKAVTQMFCGAETQNTVAVWMPAFSLSVLWHGEAFQGLGVQGAKVSAFPGFTSAKRGSNISAKSLIHGAHAVCICVPVAIFLINNKFCLKH
jgi:hypothetical protein